MYGKVLVLFALMATGYIFSKKEVLTDVAMNSINKFIVYFAYPCLIVKNINGINSGKSLFGDFLLIVGIATLIMYLSYGVAYVWGKATKADEKTLNVWAFAAASSNNGFMGFPIALLFFGQKGLLFMLANNAALNLYFFTLGIAMMKKNNGEKEKLNLKSILINIKKLILNPNIIALIIGLFTLGFEYKLPYGVNEYLGYMGDISTPMAMVYIGTTLAKSNFFKIIKSYTHWSNALFKLFLMPVITYAIIMVLPLSSSVKAMCILSSCFPVAATVPILAEQENQDAVLASELLFISTILSVIFLPIYIQLINAFI